MENLGLSPIDPTTPPAPYIGGKRLLAKRLCARISAVDHKTYAEPFVGMGGVFFRRDRAPRAEVINDYSGDVANLFRILQRHYPQFMETLKFQITSRREFERLKRADPATLTDLERAARFIYLQKLAFGGKVAGRTFGVDRVASGRFNITRLAPILEAIHERLAGVTIENLPWPEFMARYDRADTLFYIDPPYYGHEADYGKAMFDRSQFEDLASALADLKGRFILSINDCPETRVLFDRFEIEAVETTYTASRGKAKTAGELIVSN